MRKFARVSVIVLGAIVLLSMLSIKVLKSRNKYVKTFYEYPLEIRKQAVRLSLQHAVKIFYPTGKSNIPLTKKQVKKALTLGAKWLEKMQNSDGRFNYWYDPVKDNISPAWDDNFLRQAGTSLSLIAAFEALGDSTYLWMAEKNIHYLQHFYKRSDDGKGYYLFQGKAKLGGLALPMMSLIKLDDLLKTALYEDQIRELYNMITYLQDLYGTGQFKSTYVYNNDYTYEKNTNWESNIYPGETLLALANYYEKTGNREIKVRFDQAINFYRNSKFWGKRPFFPWTISALSKMSIVCNNETYYSMAAELVKKSLRAQNLNPKEEAYGSLYPVPSVFSATTLEALGDFIQAVQKFQPDRADNYTKRLKMGYLWLMKLQIDPSKMNALAYDSMALGGFPETTFNQNIRIDNTQHAISALSKYLIYKIEE